MTRPVCVVVGVGPGNGAAFARRFAAEGHAVALLARTTEFGDELAKSLPHARAWACDVTDPASIAAAFAGVREAFGDPSVVIYNAGSGVWGSFDDATAADFEASWRVNTLGAFLVGKQVVPAMKQHGGSIVVVGATASRRGGAKSTSFSSAKVAQRALAESMARSLWPQGVHVSLIVLDGIVDLPRTRKQMADKPDAFFVKPDDVAATAWWLSQQARSAWSFEVEARPFGETW